MVKVLITNYDYDVNGRRRINAVLQWSGTESLNPKDLGIMTIDWIVLSPQAIVPSQQPIPIGSLPFSGSQNPDGGQPIYRGAGPGSTITLRWAQGSSGTRLASVHVLGTLSAGTKTAFALVLGQTT